jgi:S-adenosylmethionine:tRNA ribosyltransferase-isomerase
MIPTGSTLVFNNTKVVPARLQFTKATGGGIEVFCLEPDARYPDVATAMAEKGDVFWRCMVGGAAKWKPGMELDLPVGDAVLRARWVTREPGSFTVHFTWEPATWTFAEVLQHFGQIPLPPYLNRAPGQDDAERYQTIFAREEGSVAAPTASLHFTESIVEGLRDRQVREAYTTLHVGAGTFQPVKSETLDGHGMHAEWIETDETFIRSLIDGIEGGIVPVGTTALRTVESLYWMGRKLVNSGSLNFSDVAVSQWEPYEATEPDVPAVEALEALARMVQEGDGRLVTRTQILIAPGYRFRIAKGLITNFHQPESTLLLLIAALVGDDWRAIYNHALAHDYRFLSYGDSSLLWAIAPEEQNP